jgi:hypothetical protein
MGHRPYPDSDRALRHLIRGPRLRHNSWYHRGKRTKDITYDGDLTDTHTQAMLRVLSRLKGSGAGPR